MNKPFIAFAMAWGFFLGVTYGFVLKSDSKPSYRPYSVCTRVIHYEDGSVVCVLREADHPGVVEI